MNDKHLSYVLALSYAAANKGNNKAATRAREAAYMEVEPLVKNTGIKLLSTGITSFSNNVKTKSEISKSIKTGSNSNEKQKIEMLSYKNSITNPDDALNGISKTEKTPTFTDAYSSDIRMKTNSLTKTNVPNNIRFKTWTETQTNNRNSYNSMKNALTGTDIDAGIKIIESSKGKYHYDYTDVIMNRVNEVLPEFLNHKILSYDEYYNKNNKGIFPPDPQRYDAQVLGSLLFFFNQVNHGAPWDIKRDTPWKQQFGDIKMPYYDSNPEKDETFLFRGELVTREDLGNILYGYLGSAMGIGDTTLYWGGGVAADWKNIFDGDAYDANKHYGDNEHDHNYVKKGIEMFYEDYPDSKAGINRTFP